MCTNQQVGQKPQHPCAVRQAQPTGLVPSVGVSDAAHRMLLRMQGSATLRRLRERTPVSDKVVVRQHTTKWKK